MSTVFIISAPSGSGKSTLVNHLRKLVPGLDFSISYTTRAPRAGEQNGREYFFVIRPQFEEMIRQDEFLEYAEYEGNYYGTARRFLRDAEKAGRDLLLDIDVQGAAQIKSKIAEAVSIFVLPPNRHELESRLRHRASNAEEDIQSRLVTARREIEKYANYDYILINDDLEESVEELQAIVFSERLRHSGLTVSGLDQAKFAIAERCRLNNIRDRIKPILDSFRDTCGV